MNHLSRLGTLTATLFITGCSVVKRVMWTNRSLTHKTGGGGYLGLGLFKAVKKGNLDPAEILLHNQLEFAGEIGTTVAVSAGKQVLKHVGTKTHPSNVVEIVSSSVEPHRERRELTQIVCNGLVEKLIQIKEIFEEIFLKEGDSDSLQSGSHQTLLSGDRVSWLFFLTRDSVETVVKSPVLLGAIAVMGAVGAIACFNNAYKRLNRKAIPMVSGVALSILSGFALKKSNIISGE